jgi:toxin ParE1/3/4
MKDVLWFDRAVFSLQDITDYLTERNPAAAMRVVERILAVADRLAESPFTGRPGRVPETRELVLVNLPYIIAYEIRETAVVILDVIHTARQWPESFP